MGFLALHALMIDGAADGGEERCRVSVSVPDECGSLPVASGCHAGNFRTGEIPDENEIKKDCIGSGGLACAGALVLALQAVAGLA